MITRYIVCGIIQHKDKVILGKKAKGRPPYPDVWHTPGGGVEDQKLTEKLVEKEDYDNKYLHDELKREIREELGVEIKNIRCIISKHRKQPREGKTKNKYNQMTYYYFLEYLCDYADGALKPADDLAETRWVKKRDLKKIFLTPPSQEMYRELGWIKD